MAKYRYRDRKTGRFVKEQTWERSKSKRYKREKLPPPPPPPPEPPAIVYEWLVVFTYDRTGRSFDVIATATNQAEARDVAEIFLRSDPDGKKMFDIRGKLKKGWKILAAQTSRTREDVGEAEYRADSEEE